MGGQPENIISPPPTVGEGIKRRPQNPVTHTPAYNEETRKVAIAMYCHLRPPDTITFPT